MEKAEEIQQEAFGLGADVVDWDFSAGRIKGLYCNGTIAVSRTLTGREKAAVMAEELGHHLTAAGSILDQCDAGNRKQELRGRIWAYNRLIGLTGILRAYKAGCRNRYDVAELLDVPEDFLQEALDYYRGRYGTCAKLDNYVILFEPTLGVIELI